VITRDGLGSGLWLIFLAPALAELPEYMGTLYALYAKGEYPLLGIVFSVAFMAVAIAAVVSLLLAPRSAVGSARMADADRLQAGVAAHRVGLIGERRRYRWAVAKPRQQVCCITSCWAAGLVQSFYASNWLTAHCRRCPGRPSARCSPPRWRGRASTRGVPILSAAHARHRHVVATSILPTGYHSPLGQ
jgi:hypothetical protein